MWYYLEEFTTQAGAELLTISQDKHEQARLLSELKSIGQIIQGTGLTGVRHRLVDPPGEPHVMEIIVSLDEDWKP